MKIKIRLISSIFIVSICCVFLSTSLSARSLTIEEEKVLVDTVTRALGDKECQDLSRDLMLKISRKDARFSDDQIFSIVMAAPKGAINIYVLNALIKRFPRISQQLYDVAVGSEKADLVTFNSFITAAGKAGNFAAAQAAFEEAKRQRLANVVTYASFITAAGNADNFAAAQAAFEEAKRQRLVNVFIYNSFIIAAGKAGNFAAAQAAFEEAERERLANVVTYTIFITAAGNADNFAAAQATFEEAKRSRRLVDEFTYSSFITAASNTDNFAAAQAAFEEAKSEGLANVITYNSFIIAAGKADNFAVAQKAFEGAKSKKFANVVTYFSFITAAGNAGNFVAAQAAFEEAKKSRRLVDVVTYNSFITAAGKAGDFAAAQAAFEEAKSEGLANVVTYNSFITVAGNAGNFAAAQAAFEEAKSKGFANAVTYASFVTAAGNADNFATAQAAFEEAKKSRKLVDVFTYSSFIAAAGNADKFAIAQKAFEEAKSEGLANVVTYNNFITAAGNAGNFVAAQAAFEEAKSIVLANLITYGVFINVLIQIGNVQEALRIFQERYQSVPHDFHGHSFGETYIASFLIIEEAIKKGENEIVVIIGRGNHGNKNVVKKAIQLLVKKYGEGVLRLETTDNPGRVIIRIVEPHKYTRDIAMTIDPTRDSISVLQPNFDVVTPIRSIPNAEPAAKNFSFRSIDPSDQPQAKKQKTDSDFLSETDRWYTDARIFNLLENLLGPTGNDTRNIVIIAPAAAILEHEDLMRDAINNAVGNARTGMIVVMPIHIHGNHWVGAVFRQQADNRTIQVIYIDPRGVPIEREPNVTNFIPILQRLLAPEERLHFVDLHLPQQPEGNGEDCGPFTVDNLERIARYAAENPSGLDDLGYAQILQRTRLEQPGNGNANHIRLRHEYRLSITAAILPTQSYQITTTMVGTLIAYLYSTFTPWHSK